MIRFNVSGLKINTNYLVVQKKQKRKVLNRIGAYAMTTIRNLLSKKPTKSKKTSEPNEPPFRHTNQLRAATQYYVDEAGENVQIGPELHSGSNVPEVLQFGGKSKVQLPDGTSILADVKARPYLTPKLPAIEAKFLEFIEEGKL